MSLRYCWACDQMVQGAECPKCGVDTDKVKPMNDPDSKPLKPRKPVDGPLLRPCRTCVHYDADKRGFKLCTNRDSWHYMKSMPPHEGCSTQVPK